MHGMCICSVSLTGIVPLFCLLTVDSRAAATRAAAAAAVAAAAAAAAASHMNLEKRPHQEIWQLKIP